MQLMVQKLTIIWIWGSGQFMPGRVVISFIDKSHDLSTLLKARSYGLYIAGHTHEDIDAMFKVIAYKLRKSQIPDFIKSTCDGNHRSFYSGWKHSFAGVPTGECGWLESLAETLLCRNDTSHGAVCVQVWVQWGYNEAGEARMWYRKNFSFKSWQPNEDGAPVLKAEPQGQPSWTCSQEIKHADQVHPSQSPWNGICSFIDELAFHQYISCPPLIMDDQCVHRGGSMLGTAFHENDEMWNPIIDKYWPMAPLANVAGRVNSCQPCQ